MNRFLAIVKPVGAGGLYLVEPVSAVDPGFGHPGGPVDPGYGIGTLPHPGHELPGFGHPDAGLPWAPVRPGHDLPGYGHAGHPLPVPPPAGVVTPPIVLPERPHLPEGSGIVVPLPDDVPLPTPTNASPGAEPYILWFGPGSASSVVWLTPPATPKK